MRARQDRPVPDPDAGAHDAAPHVAEPHDVGTRTWTVDELAHDAGIPTSTLRLYQHRRLLPPPERRGRIAVYGPGHRARLDLIAQLQGRGFSLAAIKDLLDAWDAGQGVGHLLGLDALVPGLARQPVRLPLTELLARFGGAPVTQADVQRAIALGLLEVAGLDAIVHDAAFADTGPALARLGIPVTEILDEYEALLTTVDAVAERFRAVFERNVWAPFVADGRQADAVPALVGDVEQLADVAVTVVGTALRARFAALAARYLAEAAASGADP
jgi:DNA-binding transcriptional MerR regulator